MKQQEQPRTVGLRISFLVDQSVEHIIIYSQLSLNHGKNVQDHDHVIVMGNIAFVDVKTIAYTNQCWRGKGVLLTGKCGNSSIMQHRSS